MKTKDLVFIYVDFSVKPRSQKAGEIVSIFCFDESYYPVNLATFEIPYILICGLQRLSP